MEKKDMIIAKLNAFAIVNDYYFCWDNNPENGKEEEYLSINVRVKNGMLTPKHLAILHKLNPSLIRLYDDGTMSVEIKMN
jgi:hypothetical protein